jgi:hypothetical protein
MSGTFIINIPSKKDFFFFCWDICTKLFLSLTMYLAVPYRAFVYLGLLGVD